MKFFAAITLACVGAATAAPQMGLGAGAGTQMGFGAPAGNAMAGTGMGAASPAWGNTRNWGPKAYGPGLNNPWAVPVNPMQMNSMVKIAESFPNLLVRVETDGEMSFTDRYGMEVDSPFDQFENPFEF